MLLWLMNLDFAAGVIVPPIPPQNDTSDGVRRSHHRYNEEKEKQEQEKQRIDEILKEDEIMLSIIQSFLKCL